MSILICTKVHNTQLLSPLGNTKAKTVAIEEQGEEEGRGDIFYIMLWLLEP